MKMTKHELLELMDNYRLTQDWDTPYFCVEIYNEEMDGYEYILNTSPNLLYKFHYYDEAYDDNLVLKANNRIWIVDAYPVEVMRKRI